MVNYCPECGGEIQYISLTKHYVCKSCGLSCTGQELNDLHDRTDQPMKPRKKLDKTAEKNTLNGTLAKNNVHKKVDEPFSLALTLFI